MDNIFAASRGVCFIDVSLELELEQRDVDDALEMDDVHKLVQFFPSLTKANSQRLLEILKAKKAWE